MRIVTKTPVNVRKGPGMAFEAVKQINARTELDASEFKKDEGKIGWYKVSGLGWICGEYVTLAKDAVANENHPKDMNSKLNLQQFASVGLGGKTVDVSGIAGGIGSSTQSTDPSSVLTSIFGSAGEGQGPDIFLRKRIFGAPYQLRNSEDIRDYSAGDGDLGLNYKEAVGESAFVSILPGQPLFLPDLDDDSRKSYFQAFDKILDPLKSDQGNILNKITQNTGQSLLGSNVDMRYFTFQQRYTRFMQYMNTLCWMFANFLGVGDYPVPGDGTPFGEYNWANWHLSNAFGRTANNVSEFSATGGNSLKAGADELMNGTADVFSKIGAVLPSLGEGEDLPDPSATILSEFDMTDYWTDFFISPNISYNESFTNQTKESMLANLMAGASDMSKEISFLLASGIPEADRTASQQNVQKMLDKAGSMLGANSNGVLGRILHGASTIINGANMVFPEIWGSSSYSRSFNIEISLKTPYGCRDSIYKDIIVPMCFWIALTAPRQNTINSYSAPFLCQFFIPGFCASEMAIVESLTITKGGDGSAWSIDGLPLEVNLSISLKDLYSNLMISIINDCSPVDAYNLLWNNSLIDYIAVGSGMDIHYSEWLTKLKIAAMLEKNSITGIFQHAKDEFNEAIATTIASGR